MRDSWNTTVGFILATAGASIGLGNIQRFPYLAAREGGAAFVFVYLISVLVFGFSLILVEFAIGRHTVKNPVCALEKIHPKSSWKWVGILGILTAFFILTYYCVIGGWAIGFTMKVLFEGSLPDITTFSANGTTVIAYTALFLCITMLVVMKGIRKGIERFSKIFMPLLFVILLILAFRSLSLPNSLEGITFYLKPDFSQITLQTCLLAMGQAFFSLCIGEAVLITYGSYASKKENLFSSAFYVLLFDTIVALLAGLIIFPAIFSFHEPIDQGVGLTFVVLPKIFLQMPIGSVFGALFFLLLSFASITTGIGLLEMPVIYLIDAKNWSRKKAVWIVGFVAFLFAIPSALSKGANSFLTNLSLPLFSFQSFYDIMDFLWGSLGMVISGGLLAIFTGWVWKVENASKELKISSPQFRYFAGIWGFIVRYIAPLGILLILLNLIY